MISLKNANHKLPLGETGSNMNVTVVLGRTAVDATFILLFQTNKYDRVYLRCSDSETAEEELVV